MQQINRTFRLAGNPAQNQAVLQLLADQGFEFAAHPFYPDAFELKSGPLPLGSSLAARFGLIYIQDASSMLPPLALLHLLRSGELAATMSGHPVVDEDSARSGMAGDLTVGGRAAMDGETAAGTSRINVLDMCSSPGGKSSLIARELERYWPGRGFVLANEPGVKRLATLRRNLQGMNMLNCGSSGFEGQSLPLPAAGVGLCSADDLSASGGLSVSGIGRSGLNACHFENCVSDNGTAFPGWDCIILDPPCSGWGTVEKNPQVMELWQGDKLKPLVGLQRLLLSEALRLLRPGGLLVYSTCTVNVQENEEQVLWAENELGGCSRLPLPPFAGFVFAEPLLDCYGCLRVPLDSPLGQGFFIAALRKDFAGQAAQSQQDSKSGKYATNSRSGKNKAENIVVSELAPAAIESALCCPEKLPPGRILLSRGNVSFYPAGGLELLGLPGWGAAGLSGNLPGSLSGALAAGQPPVWAEVGEFLWQGFPLGRSAGPGLKPRTEMSLRALMPKAQSAVRSGAAVLNLEELAPALALLSGQSLNLKAARGGQTEAGLYYKDLPLCRLKMRGGRVLI